MFPQIGNKNAIVVAHPDDETIWCGGFLAAHGKGWDVICLSQPRRDPIRVTKFCKVCRLVGAHAFVSPFTESEPGNPLIFLPVVDLSDYDFIMTHGPRGEYGHLHHIQVHHYVMATTRCPVVTFGWHSKGEGAVGFELDEYVQQAKSEMLDCYDHASPVRPNCTKAEELRINWFLKANVPFYLETFDVARA